MTPTVMTIYGTRPEAIKVAPVILALQASADLDSITVVTGLHREMLYQVNRLFGLRPAHDLDVFAPGQSLNTLASRMLAQLDPVLEREKPDAVLVQGDTTTALAGGLAAFYRGIPVVHLEAGLRSGNLYSPFPEEANRKLISQLAALHLAPTSGARDNLTREGIDPSTVAVTGNTVIDALHHVLALNVGFSDSRLRDIEASGRPVVLVTVHRRESWGEPLREIGRALRRIADTFPDHTLVLPLHRNPLVRQGILPHVEHLDNVLAIEPLDYADFARLMQLARLVVSDSGGVQEEAPSLGNPVLVLRENTERPEAVTAGTVRLVGTSEDRIVDEVSDLLTSSDRYSQMANAVNPYGDGAAAARAVAAIAHLCRIGRSLPDIAPPTDAEAQARLEESTT